MVAVDGWIYAVGGSFGNNALKCAERYDPIIDQWTPVTDMRLQRSHFGMASLDNKIYAIGKMIYNCCSSVRKDIQMSNSTHSGVG